MKNLQSKFIVEITTFKILAIYLSFLSENAGLTGLMA